MSFERYKLWVQAVVQGRTVLMQSFLEGSARTRAARSRADSSLAAVLTGSK